MSERRLATYFPTAVERAGYEVVARHRPDVVLLEVAERNLNRLAREPRQLARACDQ